MPTKSYMSDQLLMEWVKKVSGNWNQTSRRLNPSSSLADPLIDETCSFAWVYSITRWRYLSIVHLRNYELHASVAHIQQPKSSGNLIASINVSDPYHRRKEVIKWKRKSNSNYWFAESHSFSVVLLQRIPDQFYRQRRSCRLRPPLEDALYLVLQERRHSIKVTITKYDLVIHVTSQQKSLRYQVSVRSWNSWTNSKSRQTNP